MRGKVVSRSGDAAPSASASASSSLTTPLLQSPTHPNHSLPSPTPTSCACEERFVEEPLSKAIDACYIWCLCFSLVLDPDPPPSLGTAHAGKLAAAVGLDGGEQGADEVDHKGRHGLHLRPLAGGLLVASASRSISDWHKLQVLGEPGEEADCRVPGGWPGGAHQCLQLLLAPKSASTSRSRSWFTSARRLTRWCSPTPTAPNVCEELIHMQGSPASRPPRCGSACSVMPSMWGKYVPFTAASQPSCLASGYYGA
ncbi:uncharacterized protein LOC119272036 [Triticum dicoccoides]|uniref:uncharacterized protein LOC119272036 n=1 Tax=Triticum dicoccoides TaxID=85692 RepID=UPI00188FFA85|nr:uncharacterized protein LOC119272036 [Triticum dicoccoides]